MYRHWISVGLIAMGLAIVPARKARAIDISTLRGVHRILVLGDSITYSGGYVDYLQSYLVTHRPDITCDILDLGLPSETVSGLTEPGHAGGAFPRPVLSERLDRVITKTKPDLIFACYGMNDGIYYPFSEERFSKYRNGIISLAARAKQVHARLIVLTPPPFDATAIAGNTLPAGLSAYPQPYVGYDDVLTQYAHWLNDQTRHGMSVIDIHEPIHAYLNHKQESNHGYHLAGDGVHLNATGHWLIAKEILSYLSVKPRITTFNVNAKSLTTKGNAEVSVVRSEQSIRINCALPTPMPIDASIDLSPEGRASEISKYDQALLYVTNLDRASHYRVLMGGTEIGEYSAEALARGVSLLDRSDAPVFVRSADILGAVHGLRSMLTDAWLTETGHTRPGMAKGVSMETANMQTEIAKSRIASLTGDIQVALTVQPISR